MITFPAELGDVELIGVDDRYVVGPNAALGVYQMLNITTTAFRDDISGHFQIAIGESWTPSISFASTDLAVTNALNNLTVVGKAVALGPRDGETLGALTL